MLVVEDDHGAQRALKLLLHHNGYLPLTAATVSDGMNLLGESPAWVVLDLMLPDGCGKDLLQHIRDRNLAIKVAVISGTGDQVLIQEVHRLRPESFLQKPIEFSKLLAILKDS